MKEKVLTFLKAQQDYISGEEISKALGVTRASVWKVISKLKAEGYEIESSTKKGYKLVEIPNVITKEELSEVIESSVLGSEIYYYEETTSTNEVAKTLAREGVKEGAVVIADRQTSGKGRLGRTWESPSGTGIWMSLVLRPKIMPQKASQLTLIAGLSMCEAISEVTGLEAKIKWPNDVVIGNKKVCGILTEMSAEMEGVNFIVVGIGVNVNTKYFPGKLPYASSLALIGGKEYSRKQIVKAFLEQFEKDYLKYKETQQLDFCLERYKSACITLHNKVKIISNTNEYVATCQDIAEDGSLIVEKETGEREVVFSGEVSVRGLYGYL